MHRKGFAWEHVKEFLSCTGELSITMRLGPSIPDVGMRENVWEWGEWQN